MSSLNPARLRDGPISGTFGRYEIPALLTRIARRAATGKLQCVSGPRFRRTLQFRQGALVAAESQVVGESLCARLLETGKIDSEQEEVLQSHLRNTETSVEEALVALGGVPAKDVGRILQWHNSFLLRCCLRAESVEAEFHPEPLVEGGPEGVALPLGRCIEQAIRDYSDDALGEVASQLDAWHFRAEAEDFELARRLGSSPELLALLDLALGAGSQNLEAMGASADRVQGRFLSTTAALCGFVTGQLLEGDGVAEEGLIEDGAFAQGAGHEAGSPTDVHAAPSLASESAKPLPTAPEMAQQAGGASAAGPMFAAAPFAAGATGHGGDALGPVGSWLGGGTGQGTVAVRPMRLQALLAVALLLGIASGAAMVGWVSTIADGFIEVGGSAEDEPSSEGTNVVAQEALDSSADDGASAPEPALLAMPPPEILRARVDTLLKAGHGFLQKRRLRKALAEYRRAADVGFADGRVHRALGIVYTMLNEPEKAVQEYKNYLSLEPDAPDGNELRKMIDSFEQG